MSGTKDIKWLKQEVKRHSNYLGRWNTTALVISQNWVQELIDQLDQPVREKVIVPYFVANWLDKRQRSFEGVHDAMMYIHRFGWDDETHVEYKLFKWIPENVEAFVKAWNGDYEVEKSTSE